MWFEIEAYNTNINEIDQNSLLISFYKKQNINESTKPSTMKIPPSQVVTKDNIKQIPLLNQNLTN